MRGRASIPSIPRRRHGVLWPPREAACPAGTAIPPSLRLAGRLVPMPAWLEVRLSFAIFEPLSGDAAQCREVTV